LPAQLDGDGPLTSTELLGCLLEKFQKREILGIFGELGIEGEHEISPPAGAVA